MAANMDKGSRLLNLLQQLERLLAQRQATRIDGEDKQQLRYCTAKIHHYVSHDKTSRDLVISNVAYVDLLLTALEISGDSAVQQNVVYVLLELIGKNSSKRSATLVTQGATHTLLQVLVYESRDANYSEELLITIHQLLSKLGPKDRKLGVKARLSQSLPVTLNLVKNYATCPKHLQPILHVLKLYASNESNAARATGQGGVAVLLNMFDDWHRVDTKNRHVSLRKAILTCLKHITNLRAGRRAFTESGGIRILYASCEDSIDSRELESIVLMASVIMRKSFPKNRLPITSLKSVLSYNLPHSDFHTLDMGEGQGDENGYESSIDNDDDISSEDEVEASRQQTEEEMEGVQGVAPERTIDDLLMYDRIFVELSEFDPLLDDGTCPLPQSNDPPCIQTPDQPAIVIPTARDIPRDPYEPSSRSLRTPSGSSSGRTHSALTPITHARLSSRHSFPHLSTYQLNEHVLQTSVQGLQIGSSGTYSSTVVTSTSGPLGSSSSLSSSSANATSPVLLPQMSPSPSPSPSPIVYPHTGGGSVASCINIKTGASVFSLNLSPRQNRKSATPTSGSKTGRKRIGNKLISQKSVPTPGSERRLRSRQNHNDEWLPSGSATDRLGPGASQADMFDSSESSDTSPDYDSDDQSAYKGPQVYARIAEKTKCVGRFNKLAFPDMYGSSPPPYKEQLYEKPFGIQRTKVFEDIDRFVNPDQTMDHTVYDLDNVVATAGPTYTCLYNNLVNKDDLRITRNEDHSDSLKFNSQFESGNLRKAIQVRRYEYDLILCPDLNTNHHHQWFYFEVSNMEAGVKYRFNIINCEKLNSQFNFGMRPILYSVAEAIQGRPYWIRTGSEIAYYKNHFVRSAQTTGGVRGKSYYTATFTINFQHDKDVCYLAYHYPYTYTALQAQIYAWENLYDSTRMYFRHDTLCETLNGNAVAVLTITAHPPSYDRQGVQQFKSRPYIFLTGRVHPGESNASWVMKGSINFLMSERPAARALREQYIFKIVPMLNPDGVIHGSHRCSLVAEDLNRRWANPCPKLHPTIYHTKGLLQYLKYSGRVPLVYCDYHGHSRRKNVFLYGCSPNLSWQNEDMNNPSMNGNKLEESAFKTLPRLLQTMAPAFCQSNCSYVVEKSKETTARVVVWREIGVARSYTMESSYCGCDQGPYRGYHIGTKELEEMGRKFCEALIRVRSRHIQSVVGPAMNAATTNSQVNLASSCPNIDSNSDSIDGARCAGSKQRNIQLSSNSSSNTSSSNNQSEDEENGGKY